jgi:hypothetical protein
VQQPARCCRTPTFRPRASTPADVVATTASAPAVPSALEQRIRARETERGDGARAMIATRASRRTFRDQCESRSARRVNSLKSQQTSCRTRCSRPRRQSRHQDQPVEFA